jgi:adenosylcobinamide-phosphate synthase
MVSAAAVLLAWMLDARFGEPHSAWHPVAWFGRALAPVGLRLRALAPAAAFAWGAAAWLAAVGFVALSAASLQHLLLTHCPVGLALPLLALALKPAFAWRMLREEVQAVEAALLQSLEAGRARLAHLCSRDVSRLDAGAVRETAIETLAENLNDSLVAPLFWFAVGGLPAAWAWRAANTLDAMWGYHGPWEWAGKWAARADDVLGWVPARLTAVLLWRPGIDWARVRHEARLTPSPNGGWPMAMMAIRLGVRLGKPGVYVLNAAGCVPGQTAIAAAQRAALSAARGALALTVITVIVLESAAWR